MAHQERAARLEVARLLEDLRVQHETAQQANDAMWLQMGEVPPRHDHSGSPSHVIVLKLHRGSARDLTMSDGSGSSITALLPWRSRPLGRPRRPAVCPGVHLFAIFRVRSAEGLHEA